MVIKMDKQKCKDKCKEVVEKTNKFIKDKPRRSVLIALGIGFITAIGLGILMRRK